MSFAEARQTRPRPIPLEVRIPIQRLDLTPEEIAARATQRQAEQEAQRKAQAEIPIPFYEDVSLVDIEADRPHFEQTQELYKWADPLEIVEYDYDSDDELFAHNHNSSVKRKYHIDLGKLEFVIDRLEKESGKLGLDKAIPLADAQRLFEQMQSSKITEAIYAHWTRKRQKLGGKSLFRRFREPPDPNDPRPDVAFRPRKWVSVDTSASSTNPRTSGGGYARPRRPPTARKGESSSSPPSPAAPAASSSSSSLGSQKRSKAAGNVAPTALLQQLHESRLIRTIKKGRRMRQILERGRSMCELVITREKRKKEYVRVVGRIRKRKLMQAAKHAMTMEPPAPPLPEPAEVDLLAGFDFVPPPTDEEMEAEMLNSMDLFQDGWGGPLAAFEPGQTPVPLRVGDLQCVEVAMVVRRSELRPGERWEPLPPALARCPRPSFEAPPRSSGRVGRGGRVHLTGRLSTAHRPPPPEPPPEPPGGESAGEPAPESAAAAALEELPVADPSHCPEPPVPYPTLDPSLDSVFARLVKRVPPRPPPPPPPPPPSLKYLPPPRRPPAPTFWDLLDEVSAPPPAPAAPPEPPAPPPPPRPPPAAPVLWLSPPPNLVDLDLEEHQPDEGYAWRTPEPEPPAPPPVPPPLPPPRTPHKTPSSSRKNGLAPHPSRKHATLAVPKAGPARNGLSRLRTRPSAVSPPFRDPGGDGGMEVG